MPRLRHLGKTASGELLNILNAAPPEKCEKQNSKIQRSAKGDKEVTHRRCREWKLPQEGGRRGAKHPIRP